MEIILPCPNCNLLVYIQDINCAIFRHGIYKESGEQIDPHMCKDKCDELAKKEEIWGCGKPFKIVYEDSMPTLVVCDYI
jgi:hypothetical protein